MGVVPREGSWDRASITRAGALPGPGRRWPPERSENGGPGGPRGPGGCARQRAGAGIVHAAAAAACYASHLQCGRHGQPGATREHAGPERPREGGVDGNESQGDGEADGRGGDERSSRSSTRSTRHGWRGPPDAGSLRSSTPFPMCTWRSSISSRKASASPDVFAALRRTLASDAGGRRAGGGSRTWTRSTSSGSLTGGSPRPGASKTRWRDCASSGCHPSRQSARLFSFCSGMHRGRSRIFLDRGNQRIGFALLRVGGGSVLRGG